VIWLALLLGASATTGGAALDRARGLAESGRADAALEALAPMLSAGSAEALALAGLIHESSGQLLLARQRLEAALTAGELADPGSAHLAIARCHQGTGDTAGAMQHATAAVASAGQDTARLDEALAMLLDVSVTEIGPAEAIALLSGALSPGDLPQAWGRLAEGYLDRGMASAAPLPLQAAISSDPHSPSAPGWQIRIADAARLRGRADEEVAALEVLARDYTAATPWAEAQPEDVDVNAVAEHIEARIRETILQLHQDTRLMPASAAASHQVEQLIRLVPVWLIRYPDHAAAGQIHSIYGEQLLRTGRFVAAHTQHMAAWDLTEDPQHLYAAGFVAERSFAQAAPPAATAPGPLTPEARALLTTVDLYHHHFPATEAAHTLQLKAAAALMRLGRAREARARLMPIIETAPETPQAESAARAVLNSYIAASDWRGARAAAEAFSVSPGLSSPALRARLDEILAETASLR